MKILFILVAVFTWMQYTDAIAVMSMDIGSEFMKIAIVKPGVPMEIVLNKESQRKTPTLVAMRDGERMFGDAGMSTAVKFPKKAFWYITHLIGKQYDSPDVALYQKRFPYYTLKKDEDTGMVIVQGDDDVSYSVEELLAMVLEKAKEYAEAFAEQPIKDVVITVPVYLNQGERRAFMRAAEMAGLNLLQLMSNNAAVALNYGIFRRKEFNTTVQYYMFYDMGATSTTATIVGYQLVKTKEGTIVETNPQLTIKGVGFDKTLGGLEISLRLRDYLARTFNEQKLTKIDVFTNDRAMAKLLKEANRVKKVLSANNEHMAQVENLLDDRDFKGKVSRTDLDNLCSDLIERITKPVAEALKASEITMGEITDVILMGAGTRSPRIQEELQKYMDRDLGKSINTDEAAALGAVYQAAHLSKGFRVKKFIVKEGNIYPIVVQFDRQATGDQDSSSTPVRQVKRTLFGHMNPFPQKKVMTFNKHTSDFKFSVSYGEVDFMTEDNRRSIDGISLHEISLSGVNTAYTKHVTEAESKGIKAHFRMDESGILNLDKVEFVFEKQEPNAASADDEAESAWSKLGSAIGGLFGGTDKETSSVDIKEANDTQGPSLNDTGDGADKPDETGSDKPKPDVEKPSQQETETADDSDKTESKSDENEDDKKDDKKDEKAGDDDAEKKETSEDKEEDKKKDGKKKEKGDKKTVKDGKDDKNTTAKADEEKAKKNKTVTYREEITIETVKLDMTDPTDSAIKQSKQKLADLREKDIAKVELEQAKNELESFIFETGFKLENEEFIECSQEDERENYRQTLSEASDWQYEQDDDAGKEIYKDKRKDLKKVFKDLFKRVREYHERPAAIASLRDAIIKSKNFSVNIRNISSLDEDLFTEVELNTLDKVVNETDDWLNASIAEQEKSPLYQEPVFTVAQMTEKGTNVAREVQYLITKMMAHKPKAKTKTKNEKNKTLDSNSTDDSASDATADGKKLDDTAATAEEDDDDDLVQIETTPEDDIVQEDDEPDTTTSSEKVIEETPGEESDNQEKATDTEQKLDEDIPETDENDNKNKNKDGAADDNKDKNHDGSEL